jgi:hypothetical protein
VNEKRTSTQAPSTRRAFVARNEAPEIAKLCSIHYRSEASETLKYLDFYCPTH